MNETLDKILKQLQDFSELNQIEQKSVQNNLIEFSAEQPDKFIEIIRKIAPSEESVLFEIYESLSTQPEKWVDFIISEFDRIEKLTKTSKSKLKESVSSPLIALNFFARNEFSGNDKLIRRIKKGISSNSKQIIKISMDFLADIYLIDKSKYYSCRKVIERLVNSPTIEISQSAKEILNDFDNPVKSQEGLRFYSLYSFIIFFGGIYISVSSIDFYNKTFIEFSTVATTFIFCGLTTWFLHQIFTKSKLVDKSETIALGIGYGMIGCFLLLYINQKSTDSNTRNVQYVIVDRGTLAKGLHSECRQPYVKFKRNEKIKKMIFSCSDHELVKNAKFIDLTIKKGLLGFDIVIDKKLETTGSNKI